jgi:peptidoglycan-associated lipoprotein
MKTKIQMYIIFCLVAILMAFGSVSCSNKQIDDKAAAVAAEEEAKKRAAAEEEAKKAAAAKQAAAQEEARKAAAAKQAAAAAEEEAKKRAAAAAAEAEKQKAQLISVFESENIYFDYDKAELKPEAQAILQSKANFLGQNASYSVRIEGNCDERGTNEYNIALGERRADAAKQFLNSLGISTDRITTISYGEEKPVDTGHDESAWSKNRRDEFKLAK